VKNLRDDFSGPEMPDKTHLPGGAEDATHRAACLGADANGVASIVSHEDGFYHLAITQAKQEFTSQPVRASDFIGHDRIIEEIGFALPDGCFDPALERWQELFSSKIALTVTMDGPPENLGVMQNDSIGGQDLDELVKAEVMQGSGRLARHARIQPREAVSSSLIFFE
jgi:hypothetical protein